MEALEFATRIVSGEFDNCCNSQSVMGGKLWIDDVAQVEEFFGACKIIEIGHCFARKYRVVGKTLLLRPFDLRVPIGALYEAHHKAAAIAASLCRYISDHCLSALLIGLHS